MKTLKHISLSFLFILFVQILSAQSKTASFAVAGECGMCKNKIEGAAKKAGATYAAWDESSKLLIVKYQTTTSNPEKIQETIAAVGYDTPKYKASNEAYDKLHACCKYERTTAKTNCCDGATCNKEECKKCCEGGKCTSDMSCCKDGKCEANQKDNQLASCCKKA